MHICKLNLSTVGRVCSSEFEKFSFKISFVIIFFNWTNLTEPVPAVPSISSQSLLNYEFSTESAIYEQYFTGFEKMPR